MSSLKEIKGRIASVKSTKKITSAMKMVASSKLHKAHSLVERFLPYERRVTNILNDFLAGYSEDNSISSVFAEVRAIKRVAIVALSSNSSLCGAFNSNIIRIVNDRIRKYREQNYEIVVYPVGKKIESFINKLTVPVETKGSYISLMDKPNFEGAKQIADALMKDFLTKQIDRVDLVYNHFKSTGVQVPTDELFLPVKLTKPENFRAIPIDYLVEPDRKTIVESLIPTSLRTKIYAILLDSSAAEHAARTVAMQIATDNADEILSDLTIQFNKQRQQAITSEILDIIGGSEALK
ncbi:MAG: F0F1 ATP synthase subunit gamma [Tannerella sp.]|jgi:F-type H+-transporting ATPase subunit gamma|nr:F0F1 ATP synthase subunit gamma [Tannerella sp.]